MKTEDNATGILSKFSSELQFEDVPKEVVHETKRMFLDLVGCALGSHDIDKGRIAVKLAQQIGGQPEATILGTGEKVAAPIAAYANGELMNALEFMALTPPIYIGPYVSPGTLAIAEIKNVSGINFITALAAATEVSARVAASLKPGKRSFGVTYNSFGAAVGAAKIMGLNSDQIADALGLAGYFAPVPCHIKFINTPNNGMMKYGAVGWLAQGGVTAALLAEMGERGDRKVLDGEYGFWAMSSAEACNWEAFTKNLGKDWIVLQSRYKSLPCDGVFMSPLQALIKLINENDLKPEEIQQITVKAASSGLSPQFTSRKIENNVDASMSFAYNVAVVAHRIKPGPAWQLRSTIEDPSILEFMNKVKIEAYPEADQSWHQEIVIQGKNYINRRPSCVEVTARGKVFTATSEYAKWLSIETPGFKATDEDLIEKFRSNTENVFTPSKTQKAIDTIMNMERVKNVKELIETLIF